MSGARDSLIVKCLRAPERLTRLSGPQWEQLLGQAGAARLMGPLVHACDAQGVSGTGPRWLVDRLDSARARSRENERAIRWETDRIRRAFFELDVDWVLLKGSAYVAGGLPPGRGRSVVDIDVLVPEASLGAAENALRQHGWQSTPLDAYDERYYREWMHEVPPLVHGERQSTVDLHHGILPRTSRLRPDPRVLIDRAVPSREPGALVLCPTHMVLHGAAHLFHDGEVTGAIRDVVDLDALFRFFCDGDPEFWRAYIRDAQELSLERPAYYAVRYAMRVMDTPVTADAVEAIEPWAPDPVTGALMDRLVDHALDPEATTGGIAATMLLMRSHWLKMPVRMLVPHLMKKGVKRAQM